MKPTPIQHRCDGQFKRRNPDTHYVSWLYRPCTYPAKVLEFNHDGTKQRRLCKLHARTTLGRWKPVDLDGLTAEEKQQLKRQLDDYLTYCQDNIREWQRAYQKTLSYKRAIQ